MNSQLLLPTLLIYVDGCIKYVERVGSLYYASSDTFRESLYTINTINFNEPSITPPPYKQVSETNMLINAYTSYKLLRGVLVDSVLNLETRDTSRYFFVRIAPREVCKIIEIELNLIYDVFYSKVGLLLLGNKVCFALARGVSFLSVVASLSIFIVKDKSKYHKTDVGITYYLLIRALLLDLYAGIGLALSDWWPIILESRFQTILRRLRNLVTPPRRWSQSIRQYNILERFTHGLPTYFDYIFIERIKDVLIGWKYVHSVPIHEKLVDFITEEVQKKLKLAITKDPNEDPTDEIRSARGNLVFQDEYSRVSRILKPWTLDLEYDESLLTWHVATDICYRADTSHRDSQENNITGEALYYQLIKQISDYMLYIILRQQPLVSSVAGFSDIRFDHTISCGASLVRPNRSHFNPPFVILDDQSVLREFSKLFHTDRFIENYEERLLDRRSVLHNAAKLAREIQMLGEKKWEITSKVWVELMCYAAINSSTRFQVARLRQGGELFTIVWMLLSHLGLAGQFRHINRHSVLNELNVTIANLFRAIAN